MEEKKAPDIKKAPEIKRSANTVNTGLKQTQAKIQKKKKKMSAGTLVSIVLIIAVIGACAAVYFDMGGSKSIVASLLKLDTVTSSAEADGSSSDADNAQLDKREDTLKQKEEELAQKEDELDIKEQELSTKEKELEQRETTVEEAEKTVDEQQKEHYTSVAQMIEKMDVKKAAKAISGMESSQEMARVLLYMTSEQAGKVLDQINSALATEILSEMMKNK